MDYHALADLKFFLDKEIKKKTHSYVTCSVCNKPVLKKNMVKHFLKHGI